MKKKQIKQIDFTINDSCLVCDVKTDGSVLCNNCESESEEYKEWEAKQKEFNQNIEGVTK